MRFHRLDFKRYPLLEIRIYAFAGEMYSVVSGPKGHPLWRSTDFECATAKAGYAVAAYCLF